MQAATVATSAFLLRFRPLRNARSDLSFPCDEQGSVDLDALSDQDRIDYFFARTVVGRDYAMPGVQRGALQ